jgi:hypothetical protein
MPGGKKYTPPVSRAQARLFGAAAGGQIKGFSPTEAQRKLKGVKVSKLPKTSKGTKP